MSKKFRRCCDASSVVETCLFPARSPEKENPTFNGWSINSKCPKIFQGVDDCFGLPSSILMGPTYVKAPKRELAPGPPWSQIIRGILILLY